MENTILKNRYIIREVVGTGGMAIVYKGYCIDNGQEVAVKMLRPEYLGDEQFVARFRKESQIAVKYSHRNFVNTIDVGEEDGHPYIVMEYVEGNTLKELVQQRGRLSVQEVVDIGTQIADALFYAHSRKIIHRDIKPQNILLRQDGTAKVADFGIAKAADSSTVTMGGTNIMGSVHYLSPEQARGGYTNEKTDLYSLGIVLYEMAVGRVPYDGDTPVAVAIKHMQEQPVAPRDIHPDIPRALEDIILKAMEKDQELRYDNAREISRDLERVLLEPAGGFVKKKEPKFFDATRIMKPIGPREIEAFDPKPPTPEEESSDAPAPPEPETRPFPVRTKRSIPRRATSAWAILRLLIGVLVVVGIFVTMFMIVRSFLKNTTDLPAEVPSVVGETLDNAKKKLAERQLYSYVEEQYNDKVPAGIVVSQDPETGFEMTQGDTVRLVLSLGPEMAEVPDVLNRSWDEAKKLIEDAGLTVGEISYSDSDKPEGYIVDQSPAGGTELPLEETVDLTLSRPPRQDLTVMPNLVGMDRETAVEYLNFNNLKVGDVVDMDSNLMEGVVVRQEPAADTDIDEDVEVSLWVSNGQGTGYLLHHTVRVSVEKDRSQVVVLFIDDDGERTPVYRKNLEKGVHDIELDLRSGTLGEKNLIVMMDDEEVLREPVTFTGGG